MTKVRASELRRRFIRYGCSTHQCIRTLVVTAANYFMKVLPKIMRENCVPCYEFTQSPGETLYVPSGWWHGVLNLEAGVGVTHNFCDDFNFEAVWRETRTGRRKR